MLAGGGALGSSFSRVHCCVHYHHLYVTAQGVWPLLSPLCCLLADSLRPGASACLGDAATTAARVRRAMVPHAACCVCAHTWHAHHHVICYGGAIHRTLVAPVPQLCTSSVPPQRSAGAHCSTCAEARLNGWRAKGAARARNGSAFVATDQAVAVFAGVLGARCCCGRGGGVASGCCSAPDRVGCFAALCGCAKRHARGWCSNAGVARRGCTRTCAAAICVCWRFVAACFALCALLLQCALLCLQTLCACMTSAGATTPVRAAASYHCCVGCDVNGAMLEPAWCLQL